MSKINRAKQEAFGHFLKHAGLSFIKFMDVIVPEAQKFDDDLRRIAGESQKIKNKNNQETIIVIKPEEPQKTKEQIKSELEILS